MKRAIIALAIGALLAAVVLAQKPMKPWKEWNRKEAEKVFNDSAWSHTQTETMAAQSAEVTSNFGDTRGREDAVRNVSGTPTVTLVVRLFTARPIRQAYVRMLELNETPPEAANLEKMEAWANLAADDRIIVALSYAGDQRGLARIAGLLRTVNTADLKTAVFLERGDGKRLALTDYTPPARDAFGARFTFPRTLDGQPFLSAESGVLRFHAEVSPKAPDASLQQSSARNPATREDPYKLKLDVKFKTGDMMYGSALEY